MSEQMDFEDGKYTVIYDEGHFKALRYGQPWRDLTGDNLVYPMLVEAIRLKEERDASAAKLAKVEGQLAAVERLRPMWAQGHSTDSVAAQVSAAALTSLWDLLGVGNQTSAVVKLKQLLCVSAERDALAAKLAELEGQEPVAWMGFGPRDGRAEFSISRPAGSVMRDFNMRPIFARPIPAEESFITVTTDDTGRCVMVSRQDEDHRILSVIWEAKDKPAEPVNARLLEALKYCRSIYVNYGIDRIDSDAISDKVLAVMNKAIAAAESAPKAVRLTDEEINVAYFDAMKQHVRPQDANAVWRVARRAESAVLAKNGIEVAE